MEEVVEEDRAAKEGRRHFKACWRGISQKVASDI